MLDTAQLKSFQERFDAIRALDRARLVTGPDQSRLTLQDAGPHSFFDYLGKTYFVKEINRYEETSEDFKKKTGYHIHELTCLCIETGETINFEWEVDDELEVSLTLEQLTFRNLKDDQGEAIDEDDLDQIADDKDGIVINGEPFWYEDDFPLIYYRKGKEEKVYMYEFENEAHTKFLTIEEWSGAGRDEYRIYTSTPVNPGQISIISRGEG